MRRRDFITWVGGAGAVWPFAVLAQQSAVPVVGFMSARSPEDSVQVVKAFHQGLGEGGFASGRNVNVGCRWARGDYNQLPSLAAELVEQRVALLVGAGGDASARAANETTTTIPIVFNTGNDPVKAGLVQSISRPGGNVTGSVILSDTLEQKRSGRSSHLAADEIKLCHQSQNGQIAWPHRAARPAERC
ncbi:MAG TPA: ABC transporter substrate binding protein [Pseudolabrys sp.]|nr:ABC transporter substrate binding protein [Pseudolabrys sp.]